LKQKNSKTRLKPKRNLLTQYGLYLLRWQLSTPILAICLIWLGGLGEIPATIIANLIGGLLFFWVDRFIFNAPRADGLSSS